ncbi:hypothetical protein ACFOLG_04145 [Vogesella facilis]|uniref:Uncharacterized protein n=1 Tax=Vogesella facilis TaxID=1655232 RepID=A0ABV7RDJ5_9NEIS
MMKIVTTVLTRDVLWQELHFMIEYFRGMGVKKCGVLLGYSWGLYYYDDQPWQEEQIDLETLPEFICQLEEKELGNFGDSDLVISLLAMKWDFCHESDIHFEFEDHDAVAMPFINRWKALGYLK